MNDGKSGAGKIDQLVEGAVEVPMDDDQKPMEVAILRALVRVANSDVSDLKYELLRCNQTDFYFKDHRTVYKAIRDLVNDGDYVEELTVRQKVNTESGLEVLNAVFDGLDEPSEISEDQIRTYCKRLYERAQDRDLKGIVNRVASVVNSGTTPPEDRQRMFAEIRKAVFDSEATKRLIPEIQTEAEAIDRTIDELGDGTAGYQTGFDKLDKIIGGLKPGLFIIAAPPSAGKTTYVKQLADQVADVAKVPVLFFAYEQSAVELRIKSLARLSHLSNEDIKTGKHNDKLEGTVKSYKQFGERIKIIEADASYTVDTIRLMVQQEYHLTKQRPVVIIDYLQIVPASDSHLDRRAQIDAAVSEFRRIARDVDVPIILVSAISRQRYAEANMSSFKESGGIEYGADVAAVLSTEAERSKSHDERDVKLVVLKNRNGRRGTVSMKYITEWDEFEETGSEGTSYMDAIGKEMFV